MNCLGDFMRPTQVIMSSHSRLSKRRRIAIFPSGYRSEEVPLIHLAGRPRDLIHSGYRSPERYPASAVAGDLGVLGRFYFST